MIEAYLLVSWNWHIGAARVERIRCMHALIGEVWHGKNAWYIFYLACCVLAHIIAVKKNVSW